ncbi:MAG: hypothetical protein JNM70_08300 [Anaerolineae bacterium]|nr:hypothetical protein [Anaerolineae bacterium]
MSPFPVHFVLLWEYARHRRIRFSDKDGIPMRIIAHSHSYRSQDSHRLRPSAALHVSLVPPIARPQLPQLPQFVPICPTDTDDTDDICDNSVVLTPINYERQTSATTNPDGTAAIAANSATKLRFLPVVIP